MYLGYNWFGFGLTTLMCLKTTLFSVALFSWVVFFIVDIRNHIVIFFSQNMKGDSQVLRELRGDHNVADLSLDKTITPGGVAEEFTTQAASPWDVDRSSSLPWPVGADDMQDSVLGQNPFDMEGLSLLAF